MVGRQSLAAILAVLLSIPATTLAQSDDWSLPTVPDGAWAPPSADYEPPPQDDAPHAPPSPPPPSPPPAAPSPPPPRPPPRRRSPPPPRRRLAPRQSPPARSFWNASKTRRRHPGNRHFLFLGPLKRPPPPMRRRAPPRKAWKPPDRPPPWGRPPAHQPPRHHVSPPPLVALPASRYPSLPPAPPFPPASPPAAPSAAVCRITLRGHPGSDGDGGADSDGGGSTFSGDGAGGGGRRGELREAALKCVSDTGAPVAVLVGRVLMDALMAPVFDYGGGLVAVTSCSGVELSERPGDEEWGLTFRGLASLELEGSVIADVPLSTAGPLLQCVKCTRFTMRDSVLSNLNGASGGGGGGGADAADQVPYGAVHAAGLTVAVLDNVTCEGVRGAHGWACFLFEYNMQKLYDDNGPALELHVWGGSITDNVVVAGGRDGTAWVPSGTPPPAAGRRAGASTGTAAGGLGALGYGYGAVVVRGGGPVPLVVRVSRSTLNYNTGHRGAALAVVGSKWPIISFTEDTQLAGNSVRPGDGGALWISARTAPDGLQTKESATGKGPESPDPTGAPPSPSAPPGGLQYGSRVSPPADTPRPRVTITGSSFVRQNSAAQGRGGGLWSDVPVDLEVSYNSGISGNNAGLSGGGVFLSDETGGPSPGGTQLRVTSVANFRGISDGRGGLFPWSDAQVVLLDRGSRLLDNWAGGGGGGLMVATKRPLALLVLNSSVVARNTAGASGGGISVQTPCGAWTSTPAAADLLSSYARKLCRVGLMLAGKGCLRRNIAPNGDGGGISVDGPMGLLHLEDDGCVSINAAGRAGGGVYVGRGLLYGRVNGSIDGNAAQRGDGGGLLAVGPSGTVAMGRTARLLSNIANGRGGGMCFSGSLASLQMSGALVAENTAGASGGALALLGPVVSGMVINTTFWANSADDNGGAVYHLVSGNSVRGSSLTFLRSSLKGNTARDGGGGAVAAVVLPSPPPPPPSPPSVDAPPPADYEYAPPPFDYENGNLPPPQRPSKAGKKPPPPSAPPLQPPAYTVVERPQETMQPGDSELASPLPVDPADPKLGKLEWRQWGGQGTAAGDAVPHDDSDTDGDVGVAEARWLIARETGHTDGGAWAAVGRLSYHLILSDTYMAANNASTAGGALYVLADRRYVRLDVQANGSSISGNTVRRRGDGGPSAGGGGGGGGGLFVGTYIPGATAAAAVAASADVDSTAWCRLLISGSNADENRVVGSCRGGAVLAAGCRTRILSSVFMGNIAEDAGGAVAIADECGERSTRGSSVGRSLASGDEEYLAEDMPYSRDVNAAWRGSRLLIGKPHTRNGAAGTASPPPPPPRPSALLPPAPLVLFVLDSVFISNTAEGQGGAVYSEARGSATLADTMMGENTAAAGGALAAAPPAAAAATSATTAPMRLNLTRCILDSNTAFWGDGGGVLVFPGRDRPVAVAVVASRLQSNAAPRGRGGALAVTLPPRTWAAAGGAAAAAAAAPAGPWLLGGATLAGGPPVAALSLSDRTLLMDNVARGSGGGIFVAADTTFVSLHDCSLTRNLAGVPGKTGSGQGGSVSSPGGDTFSDSGNNSDSNSGSDTVPASDGNDGPDDPSGGGGVDTTRDDLYERTANTDEYTIYYADDAELGKGAGGVASGGGGALAILPALFAGFEGRGEGHGDSGGGDASSASSSSSSSSSSSALESSCVLTISGTSMDANAATGSGGAVLVTSSEARVYLNRCSLTANTAGSHGGGLVVQPAVAAAAAAVLEGLAAGNSSGGGYGGVRPQADGAGLGDSVLFRDVGDYSGDMDTEASWAVSYSTMVVSESLLVENTAAGSGGGLLVVTSAGSVNISGSNITENTARDRGGGGVSLWLYDSAAARAADSGSGNDASRSKVPFSLCITGTLVTANWAGGSGDGGGMLVLSTAQAVTGARAPLIDATIRDSTFANNTASGGSGGGVTAALVLPEYSTAVATSRTDPWVSFRMFGSLVANNSAGRAGGGFNLAWWTQRRPPAEGRSEEVGAAPGTGGEAPGGGTGDGPAEAVNGIAFAGLLNCRVSENRAGTLGGGVAVQYDTGQAKAAKLPTEWLPSFRIRISEIDQNQVAVTTTDATSAPQDGGKDTGASAFGGGFAVVGAVRAILTATSITRNAAPGGVGVNFPSGGGGGGLYGSGGAVLVLAASRVVENLAWGPGGGILVFGCRRLEVVSSEVAACQAAGNGGGGGIYAVNVGAIAIVQCRMTANLAATGGGLYVAAASDATDVTAAAEGGTLFLLYGTSIANNTAAGDVGDGTLGYGGYGGGVFLGGRVAVAVMASGLSQGNAAAVNGSALASAQGCSYGGWDERVTLATAGAAAGLEAAPPAAASSAASWLGSIPRFLNSTWRVLEGSPDCALMAVSNTRLVAPGSNWSETERGLVGPSTDPRVGVPQDVAEVWLQEAVVLRASCSYDNGTATELPPAPMGGPLGLAELEPEDEVALDAQEEALMTVLADGPTGSTSALYDCRGSGLPPQPARAPPAAAVGSPQPGRGMTLPQGPPPQAGT